MVRLLFVTFASGFAALTYEVVWLSVLSTVVGGTTVAAAATLAVFFLGLGIGAMVGARTAEKTRHPLRVCAGVELGIAACAGLFLLLLGPVAEIHRDLFVSMGHGATIIVAALLLLPPSVLMGTTLPLIGEVLVRDPDELGRKGSLVYASNTVGGALGASLAAFVLIAELGVAGTCTVAGALNLVAAGTILTVVVEGRARDASRPAPRIAGVAVVLAGTSGFFMLSLEVLWTRMLVQIVHNSVYTFGAILLVFLLSLGAGSALTAFLMRIEPVRRRARRTAVVVTVIATVAVLWSAHGFRWLTDDFQRLKADGGLTAYVGTVVMVSAATFLPAAVAGGMLFPLSLELAGPGVRSGGRGLGVLGATNTLAAIVGSLTGGFLLTRAPFGLFDSFAWIAAGYACLAMGLVAGRSWRAQGLRLGIVAAVVATIPLTLALPPPVSLRPGERILDLRQGVGGIVAVTKAPGNRKIKVNNHYTLGSTRGTRYQLRQGIVPALLHPHPERVFFIGLGSGITASAATLFDEIQSLTVVELTAEVVALSKAHFTKDVRGLYDDPRVQVTAA
ncbi:MAG: fused MFS/spermidine synthase, partial [Myxococcota bacterium]